MITESRRKEIVKIPKRFEPKYKSKNNPAQKAQKIPINFCDSSNKQIAIANNIEKFICQRGNLKNKKRFQLTKRL